MAKKIKRLNKFKSLTTTKGKVRGLTRRKKYIRQVEGVISPRGRTSFAQAPTRDMPQTPQKFTLASTVISDVAYDSKRQILEIRFVSGGTWLYHGVEELHYRAFNSPFVPSKGRYFHDHIYGKWHGKPGQMTYTPRYKEVRVR